MKQGVQKSLSNCNRKTKFVKLFPYLFGKLFILFFPPLPPPVLLARSLLFTSETIHESFINITRGWSWTPKEIRCMCSMLHVFRQNARRKHGIVFSLLSSSARGEVGRGDRKKKLYNYVSVYESHFHYVTINMFSLRFLKAIPHSTSSNYA